MNTPTLWAVLAASGDTEVWLRHVISRKGDLSMIRRRPLWHTLCAIHVRDRMVMNSARVARPRAKRWFMSTIDSRLS